jgi:hypothetical protein
MADTKDSLVERKLPDSVGVYYKFKLNSENVVICNFCKKEFKFHNSTTSLMYHINNKHTGAKKQSQHSLEVKPVGPINNFLLKGAPLSNDRITSINTALINWLAGSGRPANIVDDEKFKNFMRVAVGNSNYNPPSRTTISRETDKLYVQKKSDLVKKLESAVFVSLTADYWTSVANHNYLGVTGHWISEQWELNSCVLTVLFTEDRHYAENCAQHFSSVTSDFGIANKVIAITTDNARNVTAAMRMLPHVHIPCVAHCIQLSLNTGMNEADLAQVLSKCRKIVGHFKHSSANTRELEAQLAALDMEKLSVVQDVSTRWNSTYDMLSRLIQLRDAITAVLTEHRHSLCMLKEQDWSKMKNICNVLQHVKYVTEILGGSKYVSCSLVLPTLCHLRRLMSAEDDDPAYIARFKQSFLLDLDDRFDDRTVLWLRCASALDPRFKSLKFVPERFRQDIWDKLTAEVKAVQDDKAKERDKTADVQQTPSKRQRLLCFDSSDDEESVQIKQSSAKDIVNRYRVVPSISDNADPLAWWVSFSGAHPELAVLAKKYLAAPATSVPCERLFSKAGNIVSKKRCTLTPKNTLKLVCLSEWLQ